MTKLQTKVGRHSTVRLYSVDGEAWSNINPPCPKQPSNRLERTE